MILLDFIQSLLSQLLNFPISRFTLLVLLKRVNNTAVTRDELIVVAFTKLLLSSLLVNTLKIKREAIFFPYLRLGKVADNKEYGIVCVTWDAEHGLGEVAGSFHPIVFILCFI